MAKGEGYDDVFMWYDYFPDEERDDCFVTMDSAG